MVRDVEELRAELEPSLSSDAGTGLERLAVLTLGLMWQFVVVVALVYREAGKLNWPVIRDRLLPINQPARGLERHLDCRGSG
jgi:hypothetical protein